MRIRAKAALRATLWLVCGLSGWGLAMALMTFIDARFGAEAVLILFFSVLLILLWIGLYALAAKGDAT